MRQSIAILSVLASSACAQDVVSFFFPGGADVADSVATINSANPSTTEMHIACPTSVDLSECGWGTGLDYTVISKTRYEAHMSVDSFSMSLGCDYNTQATEMTCTVDQSGGNDETDGPVTAVLSGSEVSFMSATVVEGASLLSGGASATAAPKSSAASATSGLKTATGSAPASSKASGSSASATASGSSPATVSTAAATRFVMEGSALLALAGAAVFNVL